MIFATMPGEVKSLKAIGVSFDEPYYKVLAEELGEEHLNIYKQAITPSPKKGSA